MIFGASLSSSSSSIGDELSKPTSFFGVKLWIGALLICIVLLVVFLLSIFLLYCLRRRHNKPTKSQSQFGASKPIFSKTTSTSMDRRLLSRNGRDNIGLSIDSPEQQVVYSAHLSTRPNPTNRATDFETKPSDVGRNIQYTMREIETATNGFADENVIGSGDYGVVYRGLLYNHRRVAVKKLRCNSGRLKDFVLEVEAMWCVRHKNLVKLIGCCIEGTNRILVYEYVDNGNLQHWLHGSIGKVTPLTWDMRINIILGIVKCMVYLHEDNEPPIVHQHIKSSNILLDHQWNPKVSDLGITKLLGPEGSCSLSPPVGMSGYIAPEYANTFFMDEKADVYSVGVLIMEIISGKFVVESNENKIEAYLVDWLKSMVMAQTFEHIADSVLPEKPYMKELKRIVLIALRCVDPDVENRPKMGDIIHMLEPRDLLLNDEQVLKRETSPCNLNNPQT